VTPKVPHICKDKQTLMQLNAAAAIEVNKKL